MPAPEPRRRALAWIARGLAIGLGALYAIPAAIFVASRRRETQDDAPIDLGALGSLPDGVPQAVAIPSRGTDAWSDDRGARAGVFLVRKGSEVVALDRACPHSGCAVDWDGAHFRCPCHRSSFALDGKRLGGPAPRDLDREDVDVKDGRVLVRYRRYRPGRSDREPT